jgi:hypothetical protein
MPVDFKVSRATPTSLPQRAAGIFAGVQHTRLA